MGKRKSVRGSAVVKATKAMAAKIPYECVYEEGGLFEVSEGVFSKAYVLKEMESAAGVSGGLAVKQFAGLLNRIPQDMTVQFMVFNRLIPQEEFLKDILIVPDKEECLNGWIERYNGMLAENCDIGHNNVKKMVYLILSVKRETPEDAVRYFKKQEKLIIDLFRDKCSMQMDAMSAGERLRLLYCILHPGREDFGKRLGLSEGVDITPSGLRKRGISSKDCIAPSFMDTKHKDHLVIDDGILARSFFITSLPVSLSNSLINDITNISSNMIFSCIYEPVDSRFGFEAAAGLVTENMVIRESAKRDTIRERRERAVVRREMMLEESEEKYMDKAALKSFQHAVAGEERMMLCTFVIVIFAENEEILNRDSQLLHISTSKFACQVKCLDLQQLKGLQTAFPLCTCFVDVKRVLPAGRLAAIPPFGLNGASVRGGMFLGLNAINDNLVLYDRRQGKNPAGLIAGVEHSGKTFQCKREIFNALISTGDRVVIVSDSGDYDGFAGRLGAELRSVSGVYPFEMKEHYGLINTDVYSKTIMLEAFMEAAIRKNGDIPGGAFGEGVQEEVSREAELFLKNVTDLSDPSAVVEAVFNNKEQVPVLYEILNDHEGLWAEQEKGEGRGRVLLYHYNGLMELTLLLDHLFNRMIEDSGDNITTWLFLDSVDILLSSDQAAAFLMDYIEKMNALQNVFTGVVQSSVRLFTDKTAAFRLEDLVRLAGYHKLLNQGAIERKKYTELLNISNSLVNHLTGAELGKGVVFTPFSNVAFDDNFFDEKDGDTNKLYELFRY